MTEQRRRVATLAAVPDEAVCPDEAVYWSVVGADILPAELGELLAPPIVVASGGSVHRVDAGQGNGRHKQAKR